MVNEIKGKYHISMVLKRTVQNCSTFNKGFVDVHSCFFAIGEYNLI